MNTPVKVIATRIDKNREMFVFPEAAEITEALKNIKVDDIVDNAIVKATTDWGIF